MMRQITTTIQQKKISDLNQQLESWKDDMLTNHCAQSEERKNLVNFIFGELKQTLDLVQKKTCLNPAEEFKILATEKLRTIEKEQNAKLNPALLNVETTFFGFLWQSLLKLINSISQSIAGKDLVTIPQTGAFQCYSLFKQKLTPAVASVSSETPTNVAPEQENNSPLVELD
jgi:hypothetical protein